MHTPVYIDLRNCGLWQFPAHAPSLIPERALALGSSSGKEQKNKALWDHHSMKVMQ